IVTDGVDAITAARVSVRMAEQSPCEAESWSVTCSVVVVISRIAARGDQAGRIQSLDATAVNNRVLSLFAKVGIEISNMAFIVFESAEHLDTQAEVKSQVLADLPIILAKEGEVIGSILVIEHAAAPETAIRSADQEFLERVGPSRGVEEKELAVE